MWVGILTVFPEMFSGFLQQGMVSQAQKKALLTVERFDLRHYADNKHKAVDDRPYGGGPGMVMQVAPIRKAILAAKKKAPANTKVIYVAPEGQRLNTKLARSLAKEPGLIFVAGRYEGIDQRIIDHDIDEMISIGDYVLTGGELPVMVVIDAVIRFVPNVLGDAASCLEEAFTEENQGLLDCPHYTRPPEEDGQTVPKVLLSGDHQAIERWRKKQKLGKTWLMRKDLLENKALNTEELKLLNEYISELEKPQSGS